MDMDSLSIIACFECGYIEIVGTAGGQNTLTLINVKNCSLYTLLTATNRKPQKS